MLQAPQRLLLKVKSSGDCDGVWTRRDSKSPRKDSEQPVDPTVLAQSLAQPLRALGLVHNRENCSGKTLELLSPCSEAFEYIAHSPRNEMPG